MGARGGSRTPHGLARANGGMTRETTHWHYGRREASHGHLMALEGRHRDTAGAGGGFHKDAREGTESQAWEARGNFGYREEGRGGGRGGGGGGEGKARRRESERRGRKGEEGAGGEPRRNEA